jgi:hypothetical protein
MIPEADRFRYADMSLTDCGERIGDSSLIAQPSGFRHPVQKSGIARISVDIDRKSTTLW